jgi:hypothetical protein
MSKLAAPRPIKIKSSMITIPDAKELFRFFSGNEKSSFSSITSTSHND